MSERVTSAPIALLTPMANPTVEREMRQLLPPQCDYLVGRLVGTEADSVARLKEYAERLESYLAQFGGLELSAIAFACTASSYLIGTEREAEIAARLSIPVLWASASIREELHARGAKRIAVISPYPSAIHVVGLDHWERAGFEIVFETRLDIGSADTRAIYDLTGAEAVEPIAQAKACNPDVVLLSGTGMPTLAALELDGAPPVISSNYCLGKAIVRLSDKSAPTG